MAYTAYRTSAPVQPTAMEKLALAQEEYKKKLVLQNGKAIQDPLTIKTGWKNEAEAINKWPSVSHGDIVLYLNGKIGVSAKDTLNAYKEGKAYSYFQSQFVKEIFFMEIDSTTCILKTSVTRSTSMNEVPHRVWACMSYPEGNILSAYCTCTAG